MHTALASMGEDVSAGFQRSGYPQDERMVIDNIMLNGFVI